MILPAPKTEHPIRHARDGSIVRNDDDRGAQLFVGALDAGENNLAGFIVESAGRLVTKQTSGHLAMARAIATRCCSPPESWEGKWSCRSASPTSSSAWLGRSDVWRFGNQRYILQRGEARNKVVELKDEANMFTAIAGKLGFTGAHQVMFSPSSLA